MQDFNVSVWPAAALLLFNDPFAITAEDDIDEYGEMRFQILGLIGGLLVFVAHTQRIIDGEEQP